MTHKPGSNPHPNTGVGTADVVTKSVSGKENIIIRNNNNLQENKFIDAADNRIGEDEILYDFNVEDNVFLGFVPDANPV